MMRSAALATLLLSSSAGLTAAFAPPQPSSAARPSTSTRLHNDLKGMLSEYNTVDAVADAVAVKAAPAKPVVEKAAKVVYEKVVEAPAPVEVPPVAAVPPPEKIVEAVVSAPPASPVGDASNALDAMASYADSAMKAAEKASAAAAAISAKTAAATKSAVATKAAVSTAAGAATVAGGVELRPLLGDRGVLRVISVDPSKIQTDQTFDAAARAQENIALLKSNFMEGVATIKENLGASDVSIGADGFDIQLGDVNVNTIIENLKFEQYGAWYVAAGMVLVASQQRSKGKEIASAQYEAELTGAQAKANEAAKQAAEAAEGARNAQKLAMKIEKDSKKGQGNAILDSSRAKIAQMDKELMAKEIASLQAEVVSLRSQLSKATGSVEKAAGKKAAAKSEIEEEFPTKFTMESDPDEDGRIVELLKLMDEDNKSSKKAKSVAMEKKREEEARFVASEKMKAEKGAESAKSKSSVATKKKKKSTKKKAQKKAVKKASTKKKAAKKKATKTISKVEVVSAPSPEKVVVVKANPDDWKTLADSTLKRKTIAQLTDYLTGKGVVVTDDSGKTLKKAELLDAVRSL